MFAEPNCYVESFDAEPDGGMEDGVDADAGDAGSAMDPGDEGLSTEGSGGDVVDGDAAPGEADDETAAEGAFGANESVAASDNVDGQTEPSDGAADAEPTVFGFDKDEPASDMTAFQWGMSNDGAMGGVSADEAVDIDYDAWNNAVAAGGLDDVVVAVIDSGVDETNPDLAGVLWDEGEEYPELTVLGGDAHGFSTVPDTTSTSPISAEQSHGTHVAGIIAAEWNNEGTSGVAPNAKIMSVRSEVDAASDMLRCINYVTEAAKAGVTTQRGELLVGHGIQRLARVRCGVYPDGQSRRDGGIRLWQFRQRYGCHVKHDLDVARQPVCCGYGLYRRIGRAVDVQLLRPGDDRRRGARLHHLVDLADVEPAISG